MHSYIPQWPADLSDREPLSPADFTYRDARDVAVFAAQEPLTTWYTWPDVWHLDKAGRWRCCSKGSSLDTLERLARHPEHMVECRLTRPRLRCPDFWVVLEPRQQWRYRRTEVTEGDAQAFLALREGLGDLGVSLLDVVVFDEEHHWWSLHELTSGTTAWSFVPPRKG